MANSRLYIVHRESNTGIYLMKNSGGIWFPATDDFESWQATIRKWADDSQINYDNEPTLELVFEHNLPDGMEIVLEKV